MQAQFGDYKQLEVKKRSNKYQTAAVFHARDLHSDLKINIKVAHYCGSKIL